MKSIDYTTFQLKCTKTTIKPRPIFDIQISLSVHTRLPANAVRCPLPTDSRSNARAEEESITSGGIIWREEPRHLNAAAALSLGEQQLLREIDVTSRGREVRGALAAAAANEGARKRDNPLEPSRHISQRVSRSFSGVHFVCANACDLL